MEPINAFISMNLKNIRKEKGLTLEELGRISGVSKSMLGEIERGSTNPTILVLWKIAEGLKTPLTKLIEQEKAEDHLLIRADQAKLINNDPSFDIYSLFPYHEPHSLEIHRIELPSGSTLSNSGHQSGVEEYALLVEGEVDIKLNESEIALATGDSIRFKGDIPHCFINQSDIPASIINIMIYKK